MFQLNLTDKPLHPNRPKLLLHPSVPKYLSGVNPRTIKGQEWWDVVRKQAYRWNNHCCWACGVYQLDALYKPYLDAHETYVYDYEKFEARPGEIVALCRACHWFIHWRRVRFSRARREVIVRGLKIIVDAGLQVPYWQHRWVNQWGGFFGPDEGETYPDLEVPKMVDEKQLLSSKWKLIIDGVSYNQRGVI